MRVRQRQKKENQTTEREPEIKKEENGADVTPQQDSTFTTFAATRGTRSLRLLSHRSLQEFAFDLANVAANAGDFGLYIAVMATAPVASDGVCLF